MQTTTQRPALVATLRQMRDAQRQRPGKETAAELAAAAIAQHIGLQPDLYRGETVAIAERTRQYIAALRRHRRNPNPQDAAAARQLAELIDRHIAAAAPQTVLPFLLN